MLVEVYTRIPIYIVSLPEVCILVMMRTLSRIYDDCAHSTGNMSSAHNIILGEPIQLI